MRRKVWLLPETPSSIARSCTAWVLASGMWFARAGGGTATASTMAPAASQIPRGFSSIIEILHGLARPFGLLGRHGRGGTQARCQWAAGRDAMLDLVAPGPWSPDGSSHR